MRTRTHWLSRVAVIMMMVLALATTVFATGEEAEAVSSFYNTAWSLLPPVIAIVLALITKEVYSSLFIGILAGGLMYSSFNFEGTLLHVFNDGIVASVTDSWNMGIIIFLVILGAMVALMNKAGGSAAFGRWAETHIKSRVGAQLASILLGCLIFIDDYFNCLTVGSVMRPVTDKHNISRAKLSYIIDATAAPICIIAPISSWAAAVAGFAEDGQGFNLFLRAIPYNFYALLTIVMMIGLVVMNVDFGSMAKYEKNAIENGDLFSGSNPYAGAEDDATSDKGIVLDLVFPVITLIIACVIGMIYTGGFFSGENFIDAFANSDASVGLMLGSAFSLVFAFIYFGIRRTVTLRQMMETYIDEKKIRKSDVDFYFVTYSLTDKEEVEISAKELEEGRLIDMLLASAYVPVFQRKKLGGKDYVDGSVQNIVPIDSLLKRGYRDIIMIRIYGLGFEKKIQIPEDINLITIAPKEKLGGILQFDPESTKQDMMLGYYDGLRMLYGLVGEKYYIDCKWNEMQAYLVLRNLMERTSTCR
mgnify:CR=1 FL=1